MARSAADGPSVPRNASTPSPSDAIDGADAPRWRHIEPGAWRCEVGRSGPWPTLDGHAECLGSGVASIAAPA